MARYASDFIRYRRGMRDYDRGYRGGYGGTGAAYGGMRSDGWGSDWRRFPGEEGWLGEGFAGYPGGEPGTYPAPRPRGEFGPGGGAYDVEYGPDRERRYRGGGWRNDDTSRIRAADIMTEDPQTVTPEATVAEAARRMRDLNVGIIPVVDSPEGRRLQGVITDRDIAVRAVAEGKDADSTKVSEVMTSDVETCGEDDTVRVVLNVMEREQVRRVPITDREGRLVGIVAQADLAVDFAEGSRWRGERVAETLERVSEPAHPRR